MLCFNFNLYFYFFSKFKILYDINMNLIFESDMEFYVFFLNNFVF